MPFALSITAEVGEGYLPYLRRYVCAAHAAARSPLRELSIALVGDKTMSELHKHYMGLEGTTDVLTFQLEVDRRGIALAGEVVICLPEARRRAKIEGTSVKNELLLYAIHGLLHLAGHDDRTERSFQKMHQMEDKILAQIGVGPVFDKPETRNPKPKTRTTRRRRA